MNLLGSKSNLSHTLNSQFDLKYIDKLGLKKFQSRNPVLFLNDIDKYWLLRMVKIQIYYY